MMNSGLVPGSAALQCGPGVLWQTSVLQGAHDLHLPLRKTTVQLKCKKHHVIFKEVALKEYVYCVVLLAAVGQAVSHWNAVPLLGNALWD